MLGVWVNLDAPCHTGWRIVGRAILSLDLYRHRSIILRMYVPSAEFMYLAFTRMSGERHCRQCIMCFMFVSCLSRASVISLACWFNILGVVGRAAFCICKLSPSWAMGNLLVRKSARRALIVVPSRLVVRRSTV